MHKKPINLPQKQSTQPGKQTQMNPLPESIRSGYLGSSKLLDKVAIITGGDSGIGRSIAVHFAREGADCVILYLNEDKDAKKTQELVEREGRKCLIIAGDVGFQDTARYTIKKTIKAFGKLDILVNNAAEQYPSTDLTNITPQQLETTFRTNIFGYFYFTQAALPFLEAGASIINTTSVTAYRGSHHLVDYSATKGAIVAFTRSLALQLAKQNIRVNAVAPGPIWTPLIPASFSAKKVATFGSNVPMGRPGQPSEVGPSFVFLASQDASYMTGQVLHPNGGEIING